MLLVVKRLQFLRQFDYVSMQAKIISQNSPQRRHRAAHRSRTTCERHFWAFFLTLRALLCLTGTATFCNVAVDSNFSTRRSIVDLLGRLLRGHWIWLVNFNNFDSLLARISFNNEIANCKLTKEKCQKGAKNFGVVCCHCRITFVASLLKNPLLCDSWTK